jgi:hypothetical protein
MADLERTQTQSARGPTSSQLEEKPSQLAHETALLSEAALAEDWNRPEEGAAWSYRQPERSRSPQTKV